MDCLDYYLSTINTAAQHAPVKTADRLYTCTHQYLDVHRLGLLDAMLSWDTETFEILVGKSIEDKEFENIYEWVYRNDGNLEKIEVILAHNVGEDAIFFVNECISGDLNYDDLATSDLLHNAALLVYRLWIVHNEEEND